MKILGMGVSTTRRLYGRSTLVAAAFLGAGLLMLMAPPRAEAIPSFARATGLPCSSCHTAWPKLNRFGRAYKENGYAIERGNPGNQLQIGDRLSIPEIPPVAVILNSRPFDRKKGGVSKLRALHELEILVAGSLFKYGSIFSELELEDEGSFDPELGHAWGGIHPCQAFNIIGGYASVFAADPYNTLVGDRRLSRGRSSVIDKGFQAGVSLHDNTQMFSIYGREPFLNRLFYMFTYATDRGGDFEGEGSEDYSGRFAFDITPDFTIGAFGTGGREVRSVGGVPNDLDFARIGGDAQLEIGPLNVEAAYVEADDDVHAGPSPRESDFAFSGETYLILDKEVFPGLPDWFFRFVPLLRVDYFESPGVPKKETDLTLNFTYYAFENLKASFEYFEQLHGIGESRRFTLFLIAAL